MKFKGGSSPKCSKCGKFIGTGDCITLKPYDSKNPPVFFEELEPYHKKCFEETGVTDVHHH